MTDIINDIFLNEDPLTPRQIDAREFFPKIKLDVVSHNNSHLFQDIQKGEAKRIDLRKKHVLTIKKTSRKSLEDLYNKDKYKTNILSIFSKSRIIRVNPLSILNPLPRTHFNTLDIRLLKEIPSLKTYPDLYSFPVPLSRRTKKAIKRNRRRIAIGSVVFASLSISLILLSLAAKNYVEQETIRDYNRISALKDLKDIDAISTEVSAIKESFDRIALVFSPFRLVLDNRFYNHPQVHLASNVIHG